jgi:hypothetical protein
MEARLDDSPMKVVDLKPSNLVAHVDGHWLRNYAADFLNAAIHFPRPPNRFSPIPYYLNCHSIELSLKAFLFSAGYNREARKNLGHNLESALQHAENKSLGSYLAITTSDRRLVRNANELYKAKEFEYFESLETIYDPHKFDIDALASFASKLYDAIQAPVAASVF